jgi:CDP-diacylglycerol--glycerol-3-phosphate 3-phosphatidyltransferase
MNLPNGLTLARIFLVPLLVAVLLTRPPMTHPHEMLIATIIFLAASLTDLLDGYFARKRGQITTLGILLDPIADKLLISSAFISLVEVGAVSAWMVVLIIGREFAVTGLRSIASAQGFTISASELGKIKMVAQVVAITLLMLGAQYPESSFRMLGTIGPYVSFRMLGTIALYVVVLFAVWSAVGYFTTFWTQIDDRFKKAQERRRLILLKRRQRRQVPTP